MPSETARELVVIHYHFRPGGVRRVFDLLLPELAKRFGKITLIGGERPDTAWGRSLKKRIPHLEFTIHRAFHYFEPGASPSGLRREIREVLQSKVGPDALVWAHNLALGRNLILAREIAEHAARRGVRLVSHHHDFWCDRRWERWRDIREQGFRTLGAAASAAFCAGTQAIHAGINSADVRHLSTALPGAVWLPNPAGEIAPPGKSAVARARKWLRDELGDNAPVWIYPARFLRRKNFAEAVLLCRWLAPTARLVTTGGVSSAGEAAYAARLKNAARDGGWRVHFGLLAGREGRTPAVPELLSAADTVIMTSIQEGFGFPYLEGAGLGCRLIARKIPTIQPDLEKFRLRHAGIYDEILIPCALFDHKAEIRRQSIVYRDWKNSLPAPCRKFAEVPEFLREPERPVPFSRLSLDAQLEVLALPPVESLAACAAENPVLSLLPKAGRVEWNPHAALSVATCAARLLDIANGKPGMEISAKEAVHAQERIMKERLGAEFLHPLLMGC